MHCSFRKLIPMRIKQITVTTAFTSVFMWHRGSSRTILVIYQFIGLHLQKHYSWPAQNFRSCEDRIILRFPTPKAIPARCVTNSHGTQYSPRSFSRKYSFLSISNLATPRPTFKPNFCIRILSSGSHKHTFFKIQMWATSFI